MKSPEAKRKLRNDLLLILVLLLTGVIAITIFTLTKKEGGFVRITVDGELYGTYPLDTDADIRIEHPDGGYNLLVIRDGAAHMESATCPDLLCVEQQGWIRHTGETIVCLPNRTVAEVIGGREGEVDLAP